MDIVDRIFQLSDEKFKEQKDFAAAIDVIPQRVSAWRVRTSASYNKRLPQIAAVLGTTVQWLVTGEELPQEKKASSPEGELAKLLQEPLMEEIHEAVLKLSPESRRMILAQIRAVQALESESGK